VTSTTPALQLILHEVGASLMFLSNFLLQNTSTVDWLSSRIHRRDTTRPVFVLCCSYSSSSRIFHIVPLPGLFLNSFGCDCCRLPLIGCDCCRSPLIFRFSLSLIAETLASLFQQL
jgi:hypothetical protein